MCYGGLFCHCVAKNASKVVSGGCKQETSAQRHYWQLKQGEELDVESDGVQEFREDSTTGTMYRYRYRTQRLD